MASRTTSAESCRCPWAGLEVPVTSEWKILNRPFEFSSYRFKPVTRSFNLHHCNILTPHCILKPIYSTRLCSKTWIYCRFLPED
ncbi:hypothetical protein VTO42DRAFT_4815 [Malbranchea cinnamomea]